MKYILFLFTILFFGCEKYESEVLVLANQGPIIDEGTGEVTEGVVVFINDLKIYTISDLGQNETLVPNTYGAREQISLNYQKNKIAYFNNDLELVIINTDGTGKEILTQYNAVDFEWSQKEDVLFILEENDSRIRYYGNTNSFVSPIFAVNVSVQKFTVSKDYTVAYFSNVIGSLYHTILQVKSQDNLVYDEYFIDNDIYDFISLEYSPENKLYGVYEKNSSSIYDVYFDPTDEEFFEHETYHENIVNWTNNVKDTYDIELKNVRKIISEPFSSYTLYNVYNFRGDGTSVMVTSFDFNTNPVVFDWKK